MEGYVYISDNDFVPDLQLLIRLPFLFFLTFFFFFFLIHSPFSGVLMESITHRMWLVSLDLEKEQEKVNSQDTEFKTKKSVRKF